MARLAGRNACNPSLLDEAAEGLEQELDTDGTKGTQPCGELAEEKAQAGKRARKLAAERAKAEQIAAELQEAKAKSDTYFRESLAEKSKAEQLSLNLGQERAKSDALARELQAEKAKAEQLAADLLEEKAKSDTHSRESLTERAKAEQLSLGLGEESAKSDGLSRELQAEKEKAEQLAADLLQERVRAEQRSRELEEASAKADALSQSLRRATDEVHVLTRQLSEALAQANSTARVEEANARKYDEMPALTLYDATVTVDRMENAYLEGQGWSVRTRTGFDFQLVRDATRVIPLGRFNSGKTWLMSQICETDLQQGVCVSTQGLSIKLAETQNLSVVVLDTLGSESPMWCLVDNVTRSTGDAKQLVGELSVQEDFYRQLCFEMGRVIILVVGQMSRTDQTDLVKLAELIRKDKVRKDIIVVHNLREWTSAMLHMPRGEGDDKMNYVDRNKAMFQLADKSLDVTVGTETKKVTRHLGLFNDSCDASGKGEGAIQVWHYYLTYAREPGCANKFAIQDMRSIITKGVSTNKSLADEIADAATRIQPHFVSFSGVTVPPRIVFDAERSCFRTENPMVEASYRIKLPAIGSYFTVGSDDPPYNITMVPCVNTVDKRGKQHIEQREAYHIQIELPGLTAASFAELQQLLDARGETAALKREKHEHDGSSQWTLSFQAELHNVPEQAAEQLNTAADEAGVKLAFLPEADEQHRRSAKVVDEGTRPTMGDGSRKLQVTLRTGITDYDTGFDPLVSFASGVLGITLMKQSR